jgi:hypothetical protein
MRHIYRFQIWLITKLWCKIPLPCMVVTYKNQGIMTRQIIWIKHDPQKINRILTMLPVSHLLFRKESIILIPSIYVTNKSIPLSF